MMNLALKAGDLASKKVLITAHLSGLAFNVTSNNGPACLETSEGKIEGNGAVARYIARLNASTLLAGASFLEEAQVDQWVEFASNELEMWTALASANTADAKKFEEQLERALNGLNDALLTRTFLVGDHLTLADIAVAAALSASSKKNPTNVSRWLDTINNQPGFSAANTGKKVTASPKKDKKGKGDAQAAPAPAAADGEVPLGPDGKPLSKNALKKLAKGKGKKEVKEKPKWNTPGAGKAKKEAKKKTETPAFVNTTPKGEKKDVKSTPMAAAYEPRAVEAAWNDWWEKMGYFKGDVEDKDKPEFVMVIPPPNVTGSLHLGHALTNSVEDAITRWKRMSGFNCLWVPGTDHAGIATQVVVEKKLQRDEGKTRHDLGREEFVKKVWEWKEAFGSRIYHQLRMLGSSLDWERACFTMDEKLSKAVKEAFCQFAEKGLIYRNTRLVNWCCTLKTAISDMEVDYITIDKKTLREVPGHEKGKKYHFGVLTNFAYKFENSDDEIVVATTRIETMLGDTGVAVHPEDDRYKKYHGKHVIHPFNGRKIPIVLDPVLVDMSFGTGAVKVTPAHDPNDFETGKRHKLPEINIFNEDGTINAEGGDLFTGMKRFDCRVAISKELEKRGLLRGTADNPMRLGLCSRTGDVIEPMLKPQWFVNCDSMAEKARQAVKNGDIKITPKVFEDTWFRWLDNIRDWCVSRQLWWGHRIPAYFATKKGEKAKDPTTEHDRWFIGRTEEDARKKAATALKCKEKDVELVQDPDVLDTWFSSGLFPFSTMGWPDSTKDLKKFYPTSLLETGHDILFFWVARMVMMGLEITGEVPFKDIFLHAMVRDAHGRKMSKSLGNVIDPVDVIHGITLEELHNKLKEGNLDPKEQKIAMTSQKADFPNGISECGTDALRFALVAYTTQARDINLDINRVVGYRHFCNKLWNATKFALMSLGDDFVPDDSLNLTVTDSASSRWILSRLNAAVTETVTRMEEYDFTRATTACYNFWLYELCDVYLEVSKPVISGEDEAAKKHARNVLYTCLETGLRLLHPFMPFVTEELWQRLPRRKHEKCESIMIAPYPKPVAAWANHVVEQHMAAMQEVIRAARSLRTSYNLSKNDTANFFIKTKTKNVSEELKTANDEFMTLAKGKSVTYLVGDEEPPLGCALSVINDQTSVYCDLKGMVEPKAEIEKLEKKKAKVQNDIDKLKADMAKPGYEEKAPQAKKDENNKRMASFMEEMAGIENGIKGFKQLL